MKLGVAIPVIDAAVGSDPAALREFAQAAEALGYQDLSAPDHVLGVNEASRPGWGDRNTSSDLFHDPFALFSFLAVRHQDDRVLNASADPRAAASGACR